MGFEAPKQPSKKAVAEVEKNETIAEKGLSSRNEVERGETLSGNESTSEEVVRNESNQEKTDFRSEQSFSSRLAEYITGIKLDDPKMVERLIEDQQIVRAKYGLPVLDMRFDEPNEYERILLGLAKKLNIEIKSKSEMGQYFIEHPYVGAAHFGEKKQIGMDIDRNDISSYQKSIGVLEHELIHASQSADSPKMPIELQEYEAYVAGSNFSHLKDKTDATESLDTFFGFLIGGSVNHWYNEESKKRNLDLKPEWDNPKFFRNIDIEKEN